MQRRVLLDQLLPGVQDDVEPRRPRRRHLVRGKVPCEHRKLLRPPPGICRLQQAPVLVGDRHRRHRHVVILIGDEHVFAERCVAFHQPRGTLLLGHLVDPVDKRLSVAGESRPGEIRIVPLPVSKLVQEENIPVDIRPVESVRGHGLPDDSPMTQPRQGGISLERAQPQKGPGTRLHELFKRLDTYANQSNGLPIRRISAGRSELSTWSMDASRPFSNLGNLLRSKAERISLYRWTSGKSPGCRWCSRCTATNSSGRRSSSLCCAFF
mmetsp:Transcript_12985/g.37347  ORF Transcript_12985/g.37347 Transcript_12985/m.37347 type:complete len:267 (+) Transcript_12985:1919-2719(+)